MNKKKKEPMNKTKKEPMNKTKKELKRNGRWLQNRLNFATRVQRIFPIGATIVLRDGRHLKVSSPWFIGLHQDPEVFVEGHSRSIPMLFLDIKRSIEMKKRKEKKQ